MAFSTFGNNNTSSPSSGAGGTQNGPDLEDITTEGLGFKSISGEAKIQLLSTPWPASQLPPTTSSLMSIASKRGLVAAAGPDGVVVASTKAIRAAFESSESGDNNVKPFKPELNIPMSMRISQVAFSADEAHLVLSAENGGGLAVYDVQALMGGSTATAFEISTNSQALRALVPNPTAEKGELLAVVTVNGDLLMANLKERNFVQGPNGQILKNTVSCVSWSAKGKQLVAGLADGTAYQMTPEGIGKGDIPKPPNLTGNDYVSSITWLENNVFLTVHTPQNGENGFAPQSAYHIVTRSPPSSFMFQKISDPAEPFSSLERSPPHQFVLRLRNFPPNIDDILVVASTASTDIGLFSRSKTPMASNKPADKITGVFTMTGMSDDSKRATLPMSGDLSDTSPIGFALDLSSTEKVYKPIPGDEIDESATPLPALMVLNHEGVLSSWWIVYSESVRQGTIYSGMVVAPPSSNAATSSPAPVQQTSSFGVKPTFGQSTFGSPSTGSAFGTPSLPSAGGAFGASSGLGQKTSVWGSPSTPATATTSASAFNAPAFGSTSTLAGAGAFGKPAFGTATAPGSFGSAGLPGAKPSPWNTGSTAPTSTFGQASGAKPASPFGIVPSSGSVAPVSGGFSAFASKGGFAAANNLQAATGSVLGKPATSGALGAPSGTFGSVSQTDNKPSGGLFGSIVPTNNSRSSADLFGNATLAGSSSSSGIFGGGNAFSLGTTFKADPSTKDEVPDKNENKVSSFFGGGFGGALSEASQKPSVESPVSKEADMDAEEEPARPKSPPKASMTPGSTPSSTPAPPSKFQFTQANQSIKPGSPLKESTTPSSAPPAKFPFASPNPPGGGLFGNTTATTSTIANPATAGFSFGKPATTSGFSFADLGTSSASLGPKTPITTEPPPAITQTPATPKIKDEPDSHNGTGISDHIPEAPLPPDPTSKTCFLIGDSSPSSSEADEPSPPGTISKPEPKDIPATETPTKTAPKAIPSYLIPPSDVPGGPEDNGEDDDDLDSESEDGAASEDGSEEASEEGSGEDVAKDLSPVSDAQQTPGFTPQSSFGGLKNNKAIESSLFTKVSRPGQQPATGRPLFGEVAAAAPSLPPPKLKGPQSPRSPSPIRSAIPGRMSRPDASRSVSAPGVASQILGSSQRFGAKPTGTPTNTFSLTREEKLAEDRRREDARVRKEAEETQLLVDEEDDKLQAFLAEDIEPTKTLSEFVAHIHREIKGDTSSVPAQAELVFQDINSMLDNLGINAKTVKAFVRGHGDGYKEEGCTKQDLQDDGDWCLGDIDAISHLIEVSLSGELKDCRVVDVRSKLSACQDMQKELSRLQSQRNEMRKIIQARRDPEELATARNQPLGVAEADKQRELRRKVTEFQNSLKEAEESLMLLKTKMSSAASSRNNAPITVEAVMRTITKMTGMVEKRSGDIDVLEGQMRKLNFGSLDASRSREGSPFITPQRNRQSIRNARTPGTYGLFYTPENGRERDFQSSMRSSTGSFSRSSPGPKKKLSHYTPEEKTTLRAKLARRKDVLGKLKGALEKSGANVTLMDREE